MSVWWAMYREDAQSERADEPLSLIRDEKAAKKWGEWLAQLGPPLYVVKPVKIHVEQFEVAVIKPLTELEIQSLNPGIRKTVQWLRSHGYYTTDSGDGQTHEYECDMPGAYVHMLSDPEQMVEESRRLVRLLTEAGRWRPVKSAPTTGQRPSSADGITARRSSRWPRQSCCWRFGRTSAPSCEIMSSA